MTIYLDMDNTIADLYSVEGWLDALRGRDPSPYAKATPMCDLRRLARLLNKLQREGNKIGIVSWLSKDSTAEYDEAVRRAKRRWLARHLPSVIFDEYHIVKYGTPKQYVVQDPLGILIDDEEKNRENWRGAAFKPEEIFEVLEFYVG